MIRAGGSPQGGVEPGLDLSLVVLPGLDGTGALLAEFIDAAAPMFASVVVVTYPADAPLGYDALEAVVRRELPASGRFVLVAESFSGPIGIAIAASPPENLVALVLSTTFASNPLALVRPLAGFTRIAPVRTLPMALLAWWLLGRWATPERRFALARALDRVAAPVLRARAAAAMRVDVGPRLRHIRIPMLYIRARNDRLIRAGAGNAILRGAPQATLVEIDGPHLLLQTVPGAAARAIRALPKR